MKIKSFFLALFVLISMGASAQVISIKAARTLGVGATVTIRGIVTNGSELGSIRYLQDSTAGVAAYSSSLAGLNRGDSVELTGTLKDYNNLLEMDPVSSFTVLSTGNTLPTPEVIVPDSLNEDREGELVEIQNATFTTNPGGLFSSNTAYNFTANNQTSSIYVRSNHPLIGQIIPSGPVTLVGIASQYSYSSATSGYQLLCRDSLDIINASTISIVSPVSEDSLSQNGFVIDWLTDNPGSSEIYYGSTEALGSHMADTNATLSHHLKITGATPSQLYYIQAFSVNGMDTAFAPINVFITESNSTGNTLVYFNTPGDTSVSTGVNAVTLPNAIDDTLIQYINRAVATIDFTMYNFNSANIANVATALNNAYNRGVTVRVIFDNSANNTGLQQLDPGIKKISNPTASQYGIMHNKFIIFDANNSDANVPIVWTGSTNLTDGQINTDPNSVIIIQDKSLAIAYTLEFDEMFGSTGATPDLGASRFGPDKLDNTPHKFIIGGKNVECYFSPSDNTNDVIIREIGSAQQNIDIATMLITRTDIAYALQDADAAGVDLHILVNHQNDLSTTVWGILSTLLDSNIQDDQSQPGIMHHKYMVVDNGQANAHVLLGSHNWSNSANNKNDENTLVYYDASIANQYYQVFYYRFIQNLTNGISTNSQWTKVNVYPNPSTDFVNIEIQSTKNQKAQIQILDMNGRVVSQESTVISQGVNALKLNVNTLDYGVYFLTIVSESGNYVQKIQIK